MSDEATEAPAAPAAPEAAPAPQGETAPTPSTAGGATLGEGIKGRAAAIAKAAEVMRGATNESIEQATKQAAEAGEKARAKAERERTTPERGEDGKFKPATPTEEKPAEPPKPKEPAPDDGDASELEKLEREWRKVRSSKKAAKAERRESAAWRAEQARAKSDSEADSKLRVENPSAWLEKHGFDFREVAKSAVAKVDKTPAEKAAEAALAKAEALEAELKALRDERGRETAEERTKTALATLHREHAQAWEDSSSDYPTLSEYHEASDILDTLMELRLDFYRRTNREAPIPTVLAHMEREAARNKAKYTKAPSGAKERGERATPASKGAKTRAVGGPVTNKDAATVATPPAGLTPEERRARATRMVAEGWRR